MKIIMDCDPGIDDAVAIVMAGKSRKTELLGISVVAGNQTIDKTTKNALSVCEYFGLDIPVHAGCERPMVRRVLETAGHIHGESGLDGMTFPPLKTGIASLHSVLYIIDMARRYSGELTIAATGPLTNIAMAMRLAPDIIPMLKQIVLMGGAINGGNVTHDAEFNMHADAEAAYVVFTSGCPIVMAGLDVTRKVLCHQTIIERMRKINNRASDFFCNVITAYNAREKAVYGINGAPLHDPVTIAYLTDPSVLKLEEMSVTVEIKDMTAYGKTICQPPSSRGGNIMVAVDIDTEKFWNIVESQIRNYGG